MELSSLKYFIEVAAAGSFSRASARLGIAQPSLSRQILRLEEELSTHLFYRHGRGVTLTDSGQKLIETASTMFEMLERTKAEFQQQKQNPAGSVSLGVPPSIGATLAAPIAREFRLALPSARLRIREGFSAILSEWVEMEKLDVAIMYDSSRNKMLNASPLLLEDLFLVQNREVGDNSDVGIEALEGLPLFMPGPENGLRRVVERALLKSGIKPLILMEIDSIPALRQLAGSPGNLGGAVLPFGAIHREVRTERLNARRIVHEDMRALLVKATPSNQPISPVARTLMKIIDAQARNFIDAGVLRGSFGRSGR